MESRIRTALWLYAFGAIGLFLLVAPWTAVWTQAVAGLLPTPLGRMALLGPVRGVVSGLGAFDLLVALQVARELWERMHRAETHADADPAAKKTAARAAADGSGWHRTPPES